MSITATATFDRKQVNKFEDYEGHLMVSVKAEDESFSRTPIDTVLVLDVSGSMQSRAGNSTKIDLVKRTATKIAKNLTEDDEIAIVIYTDIASVLLKPTSGGNKGPILEAIGELRPMSTTNMSAGLFNAFELINEKFEGVKRIMLLTDGLANSGICDREGLLEIVEKRDTSATISTFGFGDDADQELLADMAKAGSGNYYYINSTDIGTVFARELGGLASCMAQNLKVKIKPSERNEVLEVVNDFNVEDEDGEAVINAEDLYVDETKHILIKMKLGKPNGKALDRAVAIAQVTVSYDDLKTKKNEKKDLRPKVKFVKAEESDEDAILEVSEQVAVLEAARAQVKAVEAAERGDFVGAQRFMVGAMDELNLCASRGSDFAEGLMADHEELTSGFTASNYCSSMGSTTRSSAEGLKKMRGISGQSAGLYSNEAMENMVKNFTDPQHDTGAVSPAPPQPSKPKEKKKESKFAKNRKRS